VTIPSELSAREAADAMKARAVGSLVVLRDGAPVGIVTDRDLLERVVAGGKDAASIAVSEVMSHPLRAAKPGYTLEQVVELMSTYGIRRIPVVENGELAGIIALDDILVKVAKELYDLSEGTRREFNAAQRVARARAIVHDVGERLRELGDQIEHAGAEAKRGLLDEIDQLRERIRNRKI
jgi:signal-transduction protein with cAMP-binding, CBS, and nucleotidyltransferase domain